jgi:iron complex transport system substrate-binding protein
MGCKKDTPLVISDEPTGFQIEMTDSHVTVTVYSPWEEGKVMSQVQCPRYTTKYQRIVCTSATHVGFLNELGMKDKIVGVCTPSLIYSLTDEERQRIIDIGTDIQLNMEALLMCQPDVVIMSTYAQQDDRAKQIEALGIPVFYCHEWMESSPLARAEWIRVFGALTGCIDKADAIFNSVRQDYITYRQSADKSSSRSIMSGMSFRGTWYVPAGGTFMGTLFRDAGAEYKFVNDPSTSSLPLSMEQSIEAFSETDIWVGCDARSLQELAAIDQKHTWFRSYQNGEVYNFLRRTTSSGANDFWESGVVHPERILHDLQQVLTGKKTDLYYMMQLK